MQYLWGCGSAGCISLVPHSKDKDKWEVPLNPLSNQLVTVNAPPSTSLQGRAHHRSHNISSGASNGGDLHLFKSVIEYAEC